MSLFYVTGISGSGKSTTGKELTKRGYEVHEVDDGLAAFYNNDTGLEVVRPLTPEERTIDWRKQHAWKIPRQKIEQLSRRAKSKPIYVCGTASNDEDFLDLFSKIIALSVDDKTLKHRIATRSSGDFGNLPHELDTILEWQKTAARDYEKMGAILVDATQPLNQVVDMVISLTTP